MIYSHTIDQCQTSIEKPNSDVRGHQSESCRYPDKDTTISSSECLGGTLRKRDQYLLENGKNNKG